jgi:hypothetical protein
MSRLADRGIQEAGDQPSRFLAKVHACQVTEPFGGSMLEAWSQHLSRVEAAGRRSGSGWRLSTRG